MADFKNVPVVDIHTDNFKELWPTVMLALKTSTFIALDTELSGLGERRRLNAPSIEDRYKAMAEIAKTRSVISLGISCFRLGHAGPVTDPSSDTVGDESQLQAAEVLNQTKKLTFVVQTFNILLLCSENYVVEPDSLKFLVDHGFDFNKQYAKGIPYYRGNDHEDQGEEIVSASIRGLFTSLVQMQVPVVFHNALVDLVFLYQSFHASLPSGLGVFLADMAEIFGGGTYDTKYIAEFQARMPASYLQYVFRRSQRENYVRAERSNPHVCMLFLSYPEECLNVNFLSCGIHERPSEKGKQICTSFAAYGWCKASTECPMSHDMDYILDNEDLLVPVKKRRRMKKRKKQKQLNATDSEYDNQKEGGAAQGESVVSEDRMMVDNNLTDIHDVPINKSELENKESGDVGDHSLHTDSVASQDDMVMDDNLTDTRHVSNNPYGLQLNTDSKEINGDVDKVNKLKQAEPNVSRTGCHRAGFDAFMTGFIFACFISQYGRYRILPPGAKLSDLGMQDYTNKITLSGKEIPLQIIKSNFVKTSKDHNAKMDKNRSQ